MPSVPEQLPLRKVRLDEMPLCVLPRRECLADTGKAVTEPNIPMLPTGIAELRKPPVLFGFQKRSLRCSPVLIHCSIVSAEMSAGWSGRMVPAAVLRAGSPEPRAAP